MPDSRVPPLPHQVVVAALDDLGAAPTATQHPPLLVGVQLARTLGAQLELFHADLGIDAVAPEVEQAVRRLAERAGARLDPDRPEGDRPRAVLAPLSGAPGHPGRLLAAHLDELDRDAGRPDVGVAVMGSHGRRPLAATLVGSTTGDFLSSSGRPAVLAGPANRPDVAPSRVACCLDGSARAESMLDLAAAWAKALGVPLWLVQAVADVPPLAWDEERNYLVGLVAALAERGVAAERELVGERHPGAGLVAWLNEQPGTMAVLSTHGRTGLAAVTLGGTAGAVVRHVHGPLLLRRPPDLR